MFLWQQLLFLSAFEYRALKYPALILLSGFPALHPGNVLLSFPPPALLQKLPQRVLPSAVPAHYYSLDYLL